MMTRTLTVALACAALGLASHAALALESDASQPIEIAADHGKEIGRFREGVFPFSEMASIRQITSRH